MAKKENRTIDENFMKEIISQGLPIKQRKVESKENRGRQVVPSETALTENNFNSKDQLENKDSDYETLFFQKMELANRRSVYVSHSTHEKLTRIVALLGKGKATVSSYVETILLQHFESHKAEINELYKQNLENPL